MPAFRMFAATLIAAVNLLTLVNFLNVPASVFSTNDLKGADTRSIKNIYTFGDSYTVQGAGLPRPSQDSVAAGCKG
ncbi:unnamed protein product, partial [Tilletia controversa]|uniref:Uncharacterized protein n=3 Tax=Tilletia TaxID=13289 RepID=A0A8X7MJP9_9BASI|nr:hypothetical protein CF336_g9213 [Tilletia laevis]KAE8180964.1 hypothetical protein CF328_g8991 [Tilletia controversa]KAE8239979.1 hypothetical protein A4X03_0g8626 [Tilletia caries]KAE8181297.1 hypothetical protein CF335_g8982 [Tilletia laevis]KAE8237871.1 hypothetical protein A4X06_0g9076 [Tilletia controversa]